MKTNKDFSNLDDAELVRLYEKYALVMDRYTLDNDAQRYNRIFTYYAAIRKELKNRPGDHRRLLLPFLNHPNIGVRLLTAKTVFALVPEQARALIEQIASSRYYPYAGEAGMTLFALDRGYGKLD